MTRRYKTTTPAPVELALGWLAAAVWFVTQGVSWLRLLAAGTALGAALLVGYSALSPVRAPASMWAPSNPTVVAPSRVAMPALVVARV